MIYSKKIIFDDLYMKVIKRNAARFDHLRVITGYSSATFVGRVLMDFPNINLTIYIGMSRQGISKEDHSSYCRLVRDGKAEIYYQINDPGTHQKILEFYNNGKDHICYVGSANFSENGFYQQREVMVACKDDLSLLFKTESSMCLSCVDPRVTNYIPISEDAPKDHVNVIEKNLPEETDETNNRFFDNSSYFISQDSAIQYGFEAQLIPDQYDQLHSGINAEPPYIYLTELVGGPPSRFKLRIAENEYEAYCGGMLGRNIMLKKEDIGSKMRQMLNIPQGAKVDLAVLKKIGCTQVSLSPIGINQYKIELIRYKE